MDQKSHTAVSVVIKMHNRYCMLFHRKKRYLHLPGGKLEPGEDWETGLGRELREELGIDLPQSRSVYRLLGGLRTFPHMEYPDGSGTHITINQYYVESYGYRGTMINKEPDKHAGILWMTKDEILESGCNYSFVIDDMIKSGIIK